MVRSHRPATSFRPWTIRALWFPLTLSLGVSLAIVSLAFYHPDEIDRVLDKLEQLFSGLPSFENLKLKDGSDNQKYGIIPPFKANINYPFCYEWVPVNESFLPRRVPVDAPIFDKVRGMLPGEDGGKHVKENVTIYAPTNKAFRSNWTYTASEGQDLVVLDVLNYKRKGIFVDVGARYWHKGSNSFALEYYHGWEGICVEPDSHFYTGLVLNRSCAVVCNNAIDHETGRKVHFHYQINGLIKNPGNDNEDKYTVTLGKIFEDFHLPPRIDYLSLDIEGHEFEGLKTINLNNYTISVISVERPSISFHNHLTSHGYWWLTHLPGNFGENMYIHRTVPNFVKMMNKYRPKAQPYWRKSKAPYLLSPQWKVTLLQ